jgi:hypothetical protein
MGNLLGVIDVKEIGIQKSLNNPCQDWNCLKVVFCKVPINPVWDIERPIETQREQIMGGYGICFTGTLEHKKLR